MELRTQVLATKLPDVTSLQQMAEAARQKVLGTYTNLQQTNTIPGLPKEIVVDQAVRGLTDQVKNLPQEELKQVKRSFCQDVIDEATRSGYGH